MPLYIPVKNHDHYLFVEQFMINWLAIAKSKHINVSSLCRADDWLNRKQIYHIKNGHYRWPITLWKLSEYAKKIGSNFDEVRTWHEIDLWEKIDELETEVKRLRQELDNKGI